MSLGIFRKDIFTCFLQIRRLALISRLVGQILNSVIQSQFMLFSFSETAKEKDAAAKNGEK
jgi:hypothetical protein